MRAVYFFLALVCVANAAQQRSPVYTSATTAGAPATTANNQPNFKSSLPMQQPQQQPAVSTSTMQQAPQIAQAREGQAPIENGAQNPAAGNLPGSSQNYLVYYYPGYRNAPVTTSTQQYAYPQQETGSSILSWPGWRDVGYGGSALALVIVGGTLLYQTFATTVKEVKARAIRELSEMKAEDAARMARSVMTAIKRLQEMNTA